MRLTFRSALLLFGLLSPTLALASFVDVPSYHLYGESIEYVRQQGIARGYSDGTFRPDDGINRAEFTKLIVEIFMKGKPRNIQKTEFIFSDVPEGSWYMPYLNAATESNLIQGYPDHSFRPSHPVTFAEAAKIMIRVSHPEIQQGNPWYEPFVRRLEEQKAIPPSIARFDQPMSRSEVTEMIWRLQKSIISKPSQTFANIRAGKIGITQRVPENFVAIESAISTHKDYQGFVVVPKVDYTLARQRIVTALQASILRELEQFLREYKNPQEIPSKLLEETDRLELSSFQKLHDALKRKWNIQSAEKEFDAIEFSSEGMSESLFHIAFESKGSEISDAQLEQAVPTAIFDAKADELVRDALDQYNYPNISFQSSREPFLPFVRGIRSSVIINGVLLGPYESVADLTLGAHSASAFAAKRNGKFFAVLNGVETGSYDGFYYLPFPFTETFIPLPSGKSFAYAVKSQGKILLIVNGRELASYDELDKDMSFYRSSLVFDSSDRLSYVIRENNKFVVVIGTEKGERFDSINSQLEIQNGKLIYLAQNGQTEYLMQDRNSVAQWKKPEGAECKGCITPTALFSPEGKKAAYLYLSENPWGYGIVVNGKKGPRHAGHIGRLAFTLNGKISYLIQQIGYGGIRGQTIRPAEWDFVRNTFTEGKPFLADHFEQYPE